MSNLFINEYKALNPSDKIIYIDLNDLKMAEKTLTKNNIETYFNEKDSFSVIEQLKNIDKIVINFPMINYGIPAILKNYIDHITVANQTFTYKSSTDEKPIGLLSNIKNIQLLATKGGAGTPNTAFTDYLKNIWEFMGATVAEPIINEMMDIHPYNEYSFIQNVEKVKDEIVKTAKVF